MKAFAAIVPLALLAGCGGDGLTNLVPNLITAVGTSGYDGPSTFVPVTASPVGSPTTGYVFRNADGSQVLTVRFDSAIQNGTYPAGDGRFAAVTFAYGGGTSGPLDGGSVRVESGRISLQNATFALSNGGETFGVTLNGNVSRSLPPGL